MKYSMNNSSINRKERFLGALIIMRSFYLALQAVFVQTYAAILEILMLDILSYLKKDPFKFMAQVIFLCWELLQNG